MPTTRYSLSFDPNCPTCNKPSAHLPEIGVWVCPFCGRLAIEYTDTADGPVLDPTERSPRELEDHFVVVSGHETFETACRNVAKNTASEERIALVVTRREFRTSTEGDLRQIPPWSYLVGEADFTENHPEAWTLRDSWKDGVAPLVGDPSDPLPAVGGEFFGWDNSVFLIPYLTIPNPDSDRAGASPV